MNVAPMRPRGRYQRRSGFARGVFCEDWGSRKNLFTTETWKPGEWENSHHRGTETQKNKFSNFSKPFECDLVIAPVVLCSVPLSLCGAIGRRKTGHNAC